MNSKLDQTPAISSENKEEEKKIEDEESKSSFGSK